MLPIKSKLEFCVLRLLKRERVFYYFGRAVFQKRSDRRNYIWTTVK